MTVPAAGLRILVSPSFFDYIYLIKSKKKFKKIFYLYVQLSLKNYYCFANYSLNMLKEEIYFITFRFI